MRECVRCMRRMRKLSVSGRIAERVREKVDAEGWKRERVRLMDSH